MPKRLEAQRKKRGMPGGDSDRLIPKQDAPGGWQHQIQPDCPSATEHRDVILRLRSDLLPMHPRPQRTAPWHAGFGPLRRFAEHPDPLTEASNWVALIIGTHLPFWPLYVWWSAGSQALPSALLTVALAPVFVAVPLISRRSGLLGRMATLLAGIANTIFTIWVLGQNSGTELFLGPCAALAAISFRQTERWVMMCFTMLPLAVWYGLQHHAPVSLHHYEGKAAHALFVLNIISVSVLIAVLGWLQAGAYQRMEQGRSH